MTPISSAWLILIASILFEVIGMMLFKTANGFSNILFTVAAIACFATSFWLMSFTLKHIELGISYAVWAAASTALVAILGIAFYQEAISSLKIVGIMCIIIGVILLNLTTK